MGVSAIMGGMDKSEMNLAHYIFRNNLTRTECDAGDANTIAKIIDNYEGLGLSDEDFNFLVVAIMRRSPMRADSVGVSVGTMYYLFHGETRQQASDRIDKKKASIFRERIDRLSAWLGQGIK